MFESNMASYIRYPESVLSVIAKIGGVLAALNIGIIIEAYNKRVFEKRINERLKGLYEEGQESYNTGV